MPVYDSEDSDEQNENEVLQWRMWCTLYGLGVMVIVNHAICVGIEEGSIPGTFTVINVASNNFRELSYCAYYPTTHFY